MTNNQNKRKQALQQDKYGQERIQYPLSLHKKDTKGYFDKPQSNKHNSNEFSTVDKEYKFYNPENNRRIEQDYEDYYQYNEMDYFQLQEFQKSKISIIKSLQKSHLYQNKRSQIEQSDLIPCSFCAKMLKLTQLDHVFVCPKGKQCIICKERYPKELFFTHKRICRQKHEIEVKNRQQNNHNNNRIKNPIHFKENNSKKNNFSSKKQQLEIKQKKQSIKQQWDQPQFDQRQFELESKIKKAQSKGLKKSHFKRLDIHFFRTKQNNKDKECVICVQQFLQNQQLNFLPCFHSFHTTCLQPWLEQRSCCPKCRQPVIIK